MLTNKLSCEREVMLTPGQPILGVLHRPVFMLTDPNLDFKPSFAGTHQVLREIWLFEHKFQARNLANFEFLGVSNL